MDMDDIISKLPKCELHIHLDGSLSSEFIVSRALDRGISLPVNDTDLRSYLHEMKGKHVQAGNTVDVGANWSVFDYCNQFLQTYSELSAGTVDVLRRLHCDNVRLCEIRFCPSRHCLEGLTEREAALAVAAGFETAAAEFGMKGGVILCGLRSYSAAETTRIAELAADMKRETGGLILGFDIAGDEGSYPISDHMVSIRRAHELGVDVTVHAGEWPVNDRFGTSSVDNLRMVLSCECVNRVGHGIMMISDELLLESIQNMPDICFEVCLTANVGWKVPSYAEHPVRRMIAAGAQVTLCCDNLLLSGAADRAATPSGELRHFIADVGMSLEDLRGVLMNGVRSSFVYKAQQWTAENKRLWIQSFDNDINSALLLASGASTST